MKISPTIINQLKKENPTWDRNKRRKWLKRYGKKTQQEYLNGLLKLTTKSSKE